jgi:polyhydroxyalkanoate synthesis regulator phasin
MKKKKVLIVLALIIVLAVPISVFAATSDAPVAKNIRGFFGIDTSKLTDLQKADVKDFTQKSADLQKDFINKMVANGSMTKEQGDAEIKRIDDMLKNGTTDGFLPGLGKGTGERPGGFGKNEFDTSKLTDQQKADLMATYKKMSDLQKDLVNKMVADSLMTKEQGDIASKKIDDIFNNLQKNGFNKGIGMFMEGFGGINFFGKAGVDSSTLTDQQKADFTDYSSKMADMQKELINKLVAAGVMTKDQGDASIKRADDMSKNPIGMIPSKDFGMRKGRFGGRGMQGNPGANSKATTTT